MSNTSIAEKMLRAERVFRNSQQTPVFVGANGEIAHLATLIGRTELKVVVEPLEKAAPARYQVAFAPAPSHNVDGDWSKIENCVLPTNPHSRKTNFGTPSAR